MKQRFSKTNKPCPECGMLMESVENTVEDSSGISHSENIIECPECGYCDNQKSKRKNKHKSKDLLFED
jgi:hypothetical protein